MSVNAGSVIIAIKAVDEASGVFGKIQASLGLLGNTLQGLGSGFQQIGSVITGFAAAGPMGAAAAGIGQLVQGLQWSVDAATKAQASWTDLQSTLHLSGAAWDTAKGKIDAFVESLRTTTVFSDTQLVGALQRMATYGMNSAQAMDALRAATELAAAKHIDLETAATAIGKAFEGNTMLLRRYGVEVQTNASAHAYLKTTFDELAIAIKEASGAQLKEFGDMLASVGIQAFDAHGKMLPVKNVMTELKAAFNSGAIDGEKFASITASLGVQFESSKTGAADFAEVLDAVNKQYGGVAAAQAQTYAGAQERLANAVDAMGEKLGAILLPALANMTEAMIPIVDWLTKGIVKVQDWIAAVQKMPEVKAATDALGVAFQGFQKWLSDVASTAIDELGPALQDLWSSFKDIFNALAPIGQAFAELWAAFSDGQGSGNILKDILGLIAENIKLIALAIKAVAPYIKMLAQAFKDAAEFITPILLTIRDLVGGFLSWLRTAFEDFYNFLVGHSLWQDLWNGMVAVVQNVGPIIGNIISGLFTLWNSIISGGMEIVKGLIVGGFQLAFDTITTIVQGASSVLASLINVVTTAIDGAQKGWTDLTVDIGGTSDKIRQLIQNLWDWLSKFWQDRLTDMVTRSNDAFLKLTTGIQTTQTTWASTLSAMEASTRNTFNAIVSDISQAVDAIIARLRSAQSQITTHSIWPDMLSSMLQQTREGMAAIQGEFDNAITGPSGIIPNLENSQLPTPIPGPQTQTASAPQQLITVPIHVYLDGTEIQTLLERRLIENLNQQGKSVRA